MNNDIKEILEQLKIRNDLYNDRDENCIVPIEYYEAHILFNYITNLQEENKHLDEVNCKLRKGGETLKDTNKLLLQQKGQLQEDLDMLDKRIDKAIEYCGLHTRLSAKDLLNILQGEDKDE